MATAELYDPATGTFAARRHLLTAARQYFTATVVDSAVLEIGGLNGATTLQSVEQYQGTAFAPANDLSTARSAHTATLLNDDTVLVVGGKGTAGVSLATAELYKTP